MDQSSLLLNFFHLKVFLLIFEVLFDLFFLFLIYDEPFMVNGKDPQDSSRELFSCSLIHLIYQRYFCTPGNWATCSPNLKCFHCVFSCDLSISIQHIGLLCDELVSEVVIKLLVVKSEMLSEESIIGLLRICSSVMLTLFETVFLPASRF